MAAEPDRPTASCVACGAVLRPGARFCGGCGRGVEPVPEPAAPLLPPRLDSRRWDTPPGSIVAALWFNYREARAALAALADAVPPAERGEAWRAARRYLDERCGTCGDVASLQTGDRPLCILCYEA